MIHAALQSDGRLVVTRHGACSSDVKTYDDIVGSEVTRHRSEGGSAPTVSDISRRNYLSE